jgi:hypothetical protein
MNHGLGSWKCSLKALSASHVNPVQMFHRMTRTLNDTIPIQSALRMNPPLQTIMSDNGSEDFRYEDVIHVSNYYACVSVQEKLKRALTRTIGEIFTPE